MKRRNKNSECVQQLRYVVDSFSYHGYKSGEAPLRNLTFFLGAGFSHAWNSKYPLGTSLFQVNSEDFYFNDNYSFFSKFFIHCGYESKKTLNYPEFTSLYYRLQLMRQHEFLQGRFWDKYSLNTVDEEIRKYFTTKFFNLTGNDFVDEEEHFGYEKKCMDFYTFFDKIIHQLTGDSGYPEGIRTNFLTTNYDFIVEKILDNCLHDILPYYSYSYRGFKPFEVNGGKNWIIPQENQNTYPLIKLNGGMEIFKDKEIYRIDYRKKKENPLPEIILPCQNQLYDSEYFQTIFPKAARILQETKVLVIIGYSFSKEDSLLRFLLNQFADSRRDAVDKYIFYIDYDRYGRESELRERALEVFPYFRENLSVYTKGFRNFVKEFNRIKSRFDP